MTKTLAEIEKDAIRERLKLFHHDIAATAKSLGVNRTKIYRFLDIERARQTNRLTRTTT